MSRCCLVPSCCTAPRTVVTLCAMTAITALVVGLLAHFQVGALGGIGSLGAAGCFAVTTGLGVGTLAYLSLQLCKKRAVSREERIVIKGAGSPQEYTASMSGTHYFAKTGEQDRQPIYCLTLYQNRTLALEILVPVKARESLDSATLQEGECYLFADSNASNCLTILKKGEEPRACGNRADVEWLIDNQDKIVGCQSIPS